MELPALEHAARLAGQAGSQMLALLQGATLYRLDNRG
jgi:hypothetical protein